LVVPEEGGKKMERGKEGKRERGKEGNRITMTYLLNDLNPASFILYFPHIEDRFSILQNSPSPVWRK